jgi:hypothetical protein
LRRIDRTSRRMETNRALRNGGQITPWWLPLGIIGRGLTSAAPTGRLMSREFSLFSGDEDRGLPVQRSSRNPLHTLVLWWKGIRDWAPAPFHRDMRFQIDRRNVA